MHCIAAAFVGAAAPEVIVVTPSALVAKTRALFPWALVHAETRRGIYGAMNDGARASCGRYLFFLGKDDIVLPALLRAVALLEQEQPFALFCDVYWGSRGVYRGRPSRFLLLARNLCHQGIIYSRVAFERHGPYLRRMRVQADHFLNIKVLWDRLDGHRVHYMKEPITWYSGAGFSNLHRDRLFWRLYPTIMREYVGNWAMVVLAGYRALRGACRTARDR
jgi:glycosyltransferase involved in cell wall biosynthesis